MSISNLSMPVFDADNHLYETKDSLTKFLPDRYKHAVQYVDVRGRTKIAIRGQISEYIPNPTFEVVARPGAMEEYFRVGNPDGKDRRQIFGEPMRSLDAYREPAPRLELMDEQGLDRTLMFPTLASVIEERMRDEPELTHAVIHSLNQWLYETWTFNYENRIFATPVITLPIVDKAIEELEWVVERGARVVLVRPAPAYGFRGPRSFALPEFDPFWEKVVEHDVLVALHSSDSGYERYSNDWVGNDSEMLPFAPEAFRMLSGWRPIEDAVASLIAHGALSRFPTAKVAVIENGSSWVAPLLDNLRDVYKKMPQDFAEDPVEVMKRSIHISPFWEEDLGALADLMGVDRVLFGSDYPHPEGLADPVSYLEELEGLPEEKVRKIMGGNLARLMNVDDAKVRVTPPGAGTAASIPALLAATVDRVGGQVAIVDGDVRLTYAELSERAGEFAAALVAAGIGVGDRVAIWSFNSWEWVVAVLGVFGAGATLVPVNTRFKGHEAAVILGRSHATALVTVTDFLDTDYVAMLRSTEVDLPDLATIVVARGEAADDTTGWADFLAGATPESRDEAARRAAAVGPDDPSDILFTSGTTGVPKGVVMTHGRTLGVATDWVAMTGLTSDDRYLMVNPYFHMFGLKAGILACVAAGATMYPEPVFDPDRALTRAAAEAITVLPGAPTLYQSILDNPDRGQHDLSTLRVAVTGAADIPVELIRRVFDELPFSVVVTGYGLTEAGTASATRPGDDAEVVATTVGRPRPGFELRILDGDNEVPTGEPGEIVLRGPTVMAEYLDDPGATADALSPDGWLRTGDLGVVDEAGNLRIVGRSKDMFIVGGFNAYPAEIENHLLRHPDVAAAAVIGIPDDRLGEVGMAFVVARAGTRVDPEQVMAWSKDQMANYKVPRVVEVIDELPVNATGKVEKNVLRERAR